MKIPMVPSCRRPPPNRLVWVFGIGNVRHWFSQEIGHLDVLHLFGYLVRFGTIAVFQPGMGFVLVHRCAQPLQALDMAG